MYQAKLQIKLIKGFAVLVSLKVVIYLVMVATKASIFWPERRTHTHTTLTGCIVSCGNLIWVWRLGIQDTEEGTQELLVVYQCFCYHRNTVNIAAGWSYGLVSFIFSSNRGHVWAFPGKGCVGIRYLVLCPAGYSLPNKINKFIWAFFCFRKGIECIVK